ncbi:MAG: hypothetical protein MUO50_01025 [Longimicrobiales bacterium]|nr:hypothetical protein [Longimicrobiales bacterium]
MRLRPIYQTALALLSTGCESHVKNVAPSSVSDSAGIEIVENLRPQWMDGEGWWVDSTPLFDLSGQDDEELFRPGSPWLLDDGRLVLFNWGTSQVRFYDEGMEFIASSGQRGEGPGEFSNEALVWPFQGDSLLIFDLSLRRITVLDSDGRFGRTALLPGSKDLPRPRVLGPLCDGTLVVWGNRNPGFADPGTGETSQRSLGLIPSSGDTAGLVGVFPGPVYRSWEADGRLGRSDLAFGGSTKFAAHIDRLYVGLPDRYEIQVFSADGILERLIRRVFKPIPVTEADVDMLALWLVENRTDRVSEVEKQRLVRRTSRAIHHVDQMPAFGNPSWVIPSQGPPDLLVDVGGNLWVVDHYRPGDDRNRWTIFSPEGVWLGSIALPIGFVPSQIGPDFLLGRWIDDLGFVHIRGHRLIKP